MQILFNILATLVESLSSLRLLFPSSSSYYSILFAHVSTKHIIGFVMRLLAASRCMHLLCAFCDLHCYWCLCGILNTNMSECVSAKTI